MSLHSNIPRLRHFLPPRFALPKSKRGLARGLTFLLCLALHSTRAAESLGAIAKTDDGEPDVTEMSLQQLMDVKVQSVYGASKHEQKVSEAPSAVTIIDSEEIRMYGYRNLADILRSVRS